MSKDMLTIQTFVNFGQKLNTEKLNYVVDWPPVRLRPIVFDLVDRVSVVAQY